MTTHRTLLAFAAALLIAAIGPATASAKTQTLHVFSKVQQFTLTMPDGTVTHQPAAGPVAAGTVMEIDSIDFKGTHKKHSKKPIGGDYLRCTFGDDPQNPDCFGYAALARGLLRFHGFDLIGGSGKYLNATGGLLKNTEVPGGSDIVVRIKTR
jgi:hypothetical protein